MPLHTPAWLHGVLKEVFPNIFFVMGTNKTHHAGVGPQQEFDVLLDEGVTWLKEWIERNRSEDKKEE